jgi:hypothetical protein
MEHRSTLCVQNAETLYIRIQSVPHRKHIASPLLRTTGLMLFREIIAVYCEKDTEHINTLCGQNVEFFYVRSMWYMQLPLSLKGLKVSVLWDKTS